MQPTEDRIEFLAAAEQLGVDPWELYEAMDVREAEIVDEGGERRVYLPADGLQEMLEAERKRDRSHLLDLSDAAQRLGVTKRELLVLIDTREVPAVHDRRRGRLYVPVSHFEG